MAPAMVMRMMLNISLIGICTLLALLAWSAYAIWFGVNSDLDNISPILTQLIPAGHCTCQTSTIFNCATCLDCPSVAPAPLPPSGWTYQYGRDDRNHGLDEDQCRVSFPGLYEDIHRAVHYWYRNGNISSASLQGIPLRNGMVRAMIVDGELYVIEVHARDEDQRRKILAALSSMFRALATFPIRRSLPNIEFVFSVEDKVEEVADKGRPVWALARKASEEALWLMPDFGFWAWENVQNSIGPYSQVVQNILDDEGGGLSWAQKERKLVWRGKLSFAPKMRRALLDIARGRSWGDVKELNWSRKNNFLSMEDHCRYMFIAHVEGRSYSASLKYRQACRSVVIAHKLQYIQHYHYLLLSSGPYQNFVEVERDFSDLPATIEGLIANQDMAKLIANNSVAIFRERYLTPAAEACYWRALWKGWAGVSPTPTMWTVREKGVRQRRGMRFESFLLMDDASMLSFP